MSGLDDVTTCRSCWHRYGPVAYRQHRAFVRGREHCYRPWRLDGLVDDAGVWRYRPTRGPSGDAISTRPRPSTRELMRPWTDDEKGDA